MRVERVVEPIPEKVTSLLPVGFRDKLHVWHGLRRLLKPAMYSALLTVTATSLIVGCATIPSSASTPTAEPTIITAIAPATPTPIPTETPRPTATATSSATPSPTASETPTPTHTPTKEPTKTPTPEATPTPKPPEKSPLSVYSVYMGDLLNEQTKAKEGMLIVASIPPKEGQTSDQLLVHAITDRNDKGIANIYTFIANPQKVNGNSIEYSNPDIPTKVSAGVYTLKGSLDGSGKILTGEIKAGTKRFGFEVRIIGAGEEKVKEAAKRIKSIQTQDGKDWKTVSIDELFRSLRDRFKFELPPS